jgi:hypothetical protein
MIRFFTYAGFLAILFVQLLSMLALSLSWELPSGNILLSVSLVGILFTGFGAAVGLFRYEIPKDAHLVFKISK